MIAIVYEKYGPPGVLQLEAMEKTTPEEDEVLIEIPAATTAKYDRWIRINPPNNTFGV